MALWIAIAAFFVLAMVDAEIDAGVLWFVLLLAAWRERQLAARIESLESRQRVAEAASRARAVHEREVMGSAGIPVARAEVPAHPDAVSPPLPERVPDPQPPAQPAPQPAAEAAPPPRRAPWPDDVDAAPAMAAGATAAPPTQWDPQWQETSADDAIGRIFGAVRRFFTEGNAPVKVGVLVLLAGIGSLLKYAVDQDWLTLPPALRLSGIAAAALAALAFGWRHRIDRPAFALTLQGGALGVLYLVVFAALRLYHLLAPMPAFALLVALAGFGLFIAVRQSSQLVAAFAAIGGFAAPLIASTGSGSHVALFGFYAVLNAAIFAAAWVRSWRALNLIGFFFTFLIGLAWGSEYYDPVHFRTVEPFLVLFFLFYVAIGFLYAWRRPGERGLWIDGTLVFGTPLFAFGLQVALLEGADVPLAWSALAVAAVHGGLALWLLPRPGAERLWTAYLLIAGGFAALAIPLAWGAEWTQAVWALEGLAFVWLGIEQRARLLRWFGVLLIAGAAASWLWLLADGGDSTWDARLFGAVLIVASTLAASWLLDRAGARLAPVLHIAGWLGFVAAGLDQVDVHLGYREWPAGLVMLAALGLAVATALARLLDWPRARSAALVAALAGMPLAILVVTEHAGGLARLDLLAWTGWLLVAVAAVRALTLAVPAQGSMLTAIALLASNEAYHRNGGDYDAGLAMALAALPWLAAVTLAWRRPSALAWPLSGREREIVLGASMAAGLSLWLLASLLSAGTPPDGIRFLPLLNALEFAQAAAFALLVLLAGRMPASWQPQARQGLLALGFLAVTMATLRAVHHLGHLPWDESLIAERLSQAALSIVWTALGIAAMVLGARLARRPLWIAGASLAGIVVVKLLLIDRQYLGDLPGIIAFLGVGGLLVAVGWFAPVPPAERSPD
jgi:uncharacterized membrane protein